MAEEGSLLEWAQQAAAETETWRQPLIAIDGPAVFDALVHEASRIATQDPGEDLILAVDGESAAFYDELDSVRAVARAVWVIGEPPARWAGPALHAASGREGDRFVVMLSSTQSIALIGGEWADAAANEFAAGWTAVRGQVCGLARRLLAGSPGEASVPDGSPDRPDRALVAMARLASAQSALLTTSARACRLDDNDLLFVLDILKAISAKRRSHDILFVFVEQIARVIAADRCSVVRIWDTAEPAGHVLASHEDARIEDLVLDLARYPELLRAVHRQETVVIDDVLTSGLTEEFRAELAKAGIKGLLVVPIVLHDENVGTLLLRAARRSGGFSPREVNFCEIVAEAASNALERAHLFDRIQEANQRLEHLATTDGLTGVHNHRFFTQRLEEEFVRAQRYNTPLSCLLFDIDDFKRINDTFGHLVGDEVLRELAGRVKGTTRQNDVFARYGGEEFAVILPHSGEEGSIHKAEAIREIVCSEPFAHLPADYPVTISVGIGVYNRETTSTYQHILRLADDSLYEAKRTGKNRVVARSA